MSGPLGSRSFLFNLTLTELAFLLFFVVLLLAATLRETNTRLRRQSEQERAELTALQETLAEARREAETAIRTAGMEGSTEQRFRHLVRKATQAEHRVEQLEEAKKVAEKRAQEAQKRAREAERKVKEAQRRLEDATRQARDAARRATHLAERCGPTGYGPPPCWLSADGRIEYIYEVTIYESHLRVTPAWPASRAAEIDRIPGARALVANQLSLPEFIRHAAPILEWSKQQEPECRHFVIIRDRADTKRSFKRSLLTVEGYFYKYLSPE